MEEGKNRSKVSGINYHDFFFKFQFEKGKKLKLHVSMGIMIGIYSSYTISALSTSLYLSTQITSNLLKTLGMCIYLFI